MSPDKLLLFEGQAELMAFHAELLGMVAANQQREACGHGVAYDEAQFIKLASEIRHSAAATTNAIRNLES